MNTDQVPSQITTWLNKMGLNFRSIRDTIVILYTLEGNEKNFRFPVIINWGGGWIQIASLLAHHDNILPENQRELYQNLLLSNWQLKDVMYSVDPHGSVFSTNHVTYDCDFENFRSELGGVIYGVSNFFHKIGPKYGITKPPIGLKFNNSEPNHTSN
ncbi:MAG: hypothetical protein ACFFE8_01240 [Candidatus Heimdallarchaeota archaeon]